MYVMPSNVNIEIVDGHFSLTPRVNNRQRFLPVDTFMRRRLAEFFQSSQVLGVVLSGTGSGRLQRCEGRTMSAGGVTFAQDPETAKFDGMPKNAIDTDHVTFILSPQDIAKELVLLQDRSPCRFPRLAMARASKVSIDDDAIFGAILSEVSAAQGVDFREYKPNTIRRRTRAERIAALGLANMEEYRLYLAGPSRRSNQTLSAYSRSGNGVLPQSGEYSRISQVSSFRRLWETKRRRPFVSGWLPAPPARKSIHSPSHCWSFWACKPTMFAFKSSAPT